MNESDHNRRRKGASGSTDTLLPASASRRRPRAGPLALAAPAAVGMVVLFVVPLLIFIAYSFLTGSEFAVSAPLTPGNYTHFFRAPATATLVRNSAIVGFLVAMVTLVLALFVAYWLRYAAGRLRFPVLFLVTSTMFASFLVRIYAWRTMLGGHGVVNEALRSLGLIDEPLGFLLYSRTAVVVAQVHLFLPFVVLMLYAAFGPLEPRYLEAAHDLGATAPTRWRRLILPCIGAPAITAFLFVFVLAASDYVTPQFLGGTSGVLLGSRVQMSFKQIGDWAGGAAAAVTMLVAFALLYGASRLAIRVMRLDQIRWTT